VGTLGPASDSPEIISKLIQAGLNVTRLNFSHGDHAAHEQVFQRVRNTARELGRSVAILQDLQGPKIRLGQLKGQLSFSLGDEITLSSGNDFVGEGHRLPTTYNRLGDDVKAGETALLADGAMALEILETRAGEVRCRVLNDGVLSSSKGINLPGSSCLFLRLWKRTSET